MPRLYDVVSLGVSYGPTYYDPPESNYSETHTLTRNEPNRVTVDQSGSGRAGTFTVDVVGSDTGSDNASGGGSTYFNSVTASGDSSKHAAWHLNVSGNYALFGGGYPGYPPEYGVNPIFTVTGATYHEDGNDSSSRRVNQVSNSGGGSTSDGTRTGSYTLDWTAGRVNNALAYTTYSYTASRSDHVTERSESGNGYYDQVEITAPIGVTTTLSNGVASSVPSGNMTTHNTGRRYDPDNAPSYARDYDYTNSPPPPTSSTVNLGAVPVSTDGWIWLADGGSSKDFTFHGVTVVNSDLDSTASYHQSYGMSYPRLDIDSFDWNYKGSDSAHTVEDVPGVFGTGTSLFHRDDLFEFVELRGYSKWP